MSNLDQTSLHGDERALLERFVDVLAEAAGSDLHGVWLFGSRARGLAPRDESDVDVLVLVQDASWDGKQRVHAALDVAAEQLGLQEVAWSFSLHVNSPGWLEQRRTVRSFFVAEVDRDKVVLHGAP